MVLQDKAVQIYWVYANNIQELPQLVLNISDRMVIVKEHQPQQHLVQQEPVPMHQHQLTQTLHALLSKLDVLQLELDVLPF